TTKLATDIADADESKSIAYIKSLLEKENLNTSEENIFIVAACKEKGIAFLKGEAKVSIRKNEDVKTNNLSQENKFTVSVNGNKYHVEVNAGFDKDVNIKSIVKTNNDNVEARKPQINDDKAIIASMNANVFKILVKENDSVKAGQVVAVLEAMKMEIEVNASKDGEIAELLVNAGDSVNEGQVLMTYK
ncbi:biotin/lipoyl-containing protein, partial [Campylobacter lari]